MTSKTKIIGISNRIHLNLLESVLADYLHTGIFHKEEYLNLISQYNEGQNRAGKVVSHLSSIITKNKKLLTFLKKHLGEDVLLNLSKSEKRSLYTCLLCNAFPIIYDILIIAAQTLTIQESISKQVIIQKISATYGSNRSTDIAVSETLTILVDLELLKRTKIGIYEKTEPITLFNKYLSEIIIYTDIKQSQIKTAILEDLIYKPWYTYFDISTTNPNEFTQLLKFKESSIDQGYITIHNN